MTKREAPLPFYLGVRDEGKSRTWLERWQRRRALRRYLRAKEATR